MSNCTLPGSAKTGKILRPVKLLSTPITDLPGRIAKATVSSSRVAPTTIHWYCFITLRGKILLQRSGTHCKVSNRGTYNLFTRDAISFAVFLTKRLCAKVDWIRSESDFIRYSLFFCSMPLSSGFRSLYTQFLSMYRSRDDVSHRISNIHSILMTRRPIK